MELLELVSNRPSISIIHCLLLPLRLVHLIVTRLEYLPHKTSY